MSPSSHAAVWRSVQLGRVSSLELFHLHRKRNWALQHQKGPSLSIRREHNVVEEEVVTASLHHSGTNEPGALTPPCRRTQ